MSREVCGVCWCPYDEETGECACAPTPNEPELMVRQKPLTEEEIDGLMQSIGLRCADDGNERMANHAEWERRQRRRIARAIERAHGITEEMK